MNPHDSLAGLDVVRLHGGVGAGGGHVDCHNHDPGGLRLLHCGLDGLRVGGVQQDKVDVSGNEVVDLRELLAHVVVGRYSRERSRAD